MLFAPFGCIHPPPPACPAFLFMQNLSPRDIAGSDFMKLKVSAESLIMDISIKFKSNCDMLLYNYLNPLGPIADIYHMYTQEKYK